MRILEISRRARTSPSTYLKLWFVPALMVLPGSYLYVWFNFSAGRSSPILWSILMLLLILVSPGIVSNDIWQTILEYETGSFIDLGTQQLVYWDGPRPAQRHLINLNTIASIKAMELVKDEDRIEITDHDGHKHSLRAHHVPGTVTTWAQTFAHQFPKANVILSSESTPSKI